MKACVIGFAEHIILAFSIVIPIFAIVSFRSCMTSGSDESCYHSLTLISVHMCLLDFFNHVFVFLSMSRIFFSIFVNLSLICLYLPSPSFIFTMGEFIPCNCAPLNPRFFVETFPSFRRFSSVLLMRRLFFKTNASSLGLVSLPSLTPANFLFCLYLLLIPVYPLTRSYPCLPAVSETSQSWFLFQCCFLLLFFSHSILFHDVRGMSYLAGLQIFSRLHPILTLLSVFLAFNADSLSAARSHVYC